MLTEVLTKFRHEVLAKEPYRMNLVELLHANENAHTRILVKLLRYNHNDGNLEFARSFVRKFVPKVDVQAPEVWEQIDYIDAQIGEHGRYAVVVENKINWAIDQDKQIERYIATAQERLGVSSNQLYVIYLTDSGIKTPSENSLTDKAKDVLGITAETDGRLIKLNYRDDIIPWLAEDVLPFCRHGDVQTIHAIEQYLDYLRNRLVDKPEFNACEEGFFTSVLGTTSSLKQSYGTLKALAEGLKNAEPTAKEDKKRNCQSFVAERTSLLELVERKMDALLRQDYSADWGRSIPLIVSRIRDWGSTVKYYGPKTWQGTTIIVSEVELDDGARMKFEISVGDNGKLAIGFFDNAYKRVLAEHYPNLVDLFNELFGTGEQSNGNTGLWRTLDAPSNEFRMEDFLHEKADRFMRCFVADVATHSKA